MHHILCLDIGGTNPRMAMMAVKGFGSYEMVKVYEVKTRVPDIIPEINKFLAEAAKEGIATKTCCASVAGPVFNNGCEHPTNHEFKVIGSDIQARTACKNALVINDFQAIGEAVVIIDPDRNDKIIKIPAFKEDMEHFHEVSRNPTGVRAVIGPGTGLGVAFLTFQNGGYSVHPSEAGHLMMGSSKDTEVLFDFLRDKTEIGRAHV